MKFYGTWRKKANKGMTEPTSPSSQIRNIRKVANWQNILKNSECERCYAASASIETVNELYIE
jgi:hypothetical protein